MTAMTREAPANATGDAAKLDFPAMAIGARSGARLVVRTMKRFFGVALSVAALALLLIPFGAETTAQFLLKLMFALVLGFVGVALWQAGDKVETPEFEIDVVRREVRLMRGFGPSRAIVARSRFADLGGAAIHGKMVTFWDQDDEMLAEVTIADDQALRGLQRVLQDEGVAV